MTNVDVRVWDYLNSKLIAYLLLVPCNWREVFQLSVDLVNDIVSVHEMKIFLNNITFLYR
jgi:hypothetical protein